MLVNARYKQALLHNYRAQGRTSSLTPSVVALHPDLAKRTKALPTQPQALTTSPCCHDQALWPEAPTHLNSQGPKLARY